MSSTVQNVVSQISAVVADAATPAAVKQWLVSLCEQLATECTATDPRFVKGEAMPTTTGAQADLYAEVREKRLAMDKEAAAVKDRETEIFNTIIATLNESTDTGAAGKHHRVQRVTKTVQNVADWPAFWGFIQQTGSFEMLQKRLADKAVTEYTEANGLPPGIVTAEVATLSFSKI